MEFMKAGGADLSKVKIHHTSDTEFEFRAAKQIKFKDSSMTIPRSLILNKKQAEEICPLAQKLTDADAGLKVNELLAVALIVEEKKEDSRLSHYLKTLPANADHIPNHYDENAINRLGHSHIVEAIVKNKA